MSDLILTSYRHASPVSVVHEFFEAVKKLQKYVRSVYNSLYRALEPMFLCSHDVVNNLDEVVKIRALFGILEGQV